MGIESLARGLRTKIAIVVLVGVVLAGPACGGGEPASSGRQDVPEQRSEESSASGKKGASGGKTVASGEKTASSGEGVLSGERAELARAEVGEGEISNMVPADGRPDPPRPLPKNPPEGIEVYPATTNKTIRGPIDYDRQPPTNGDHDPLWQNCGFYEKPVKDRHAVHSMDHGVVWITFRPELPEEQIDALRPYGDERYVVVSPYPGQDAPVIATSWRVQLELDGADDPRLRRFVDGFRISEISPLSGNRCEGGVGNPKG